MDSESIKITDAELKKLILSKISADDMSKLKKLEVNIRKLHYLDDNTCYFRSKDSYVCSISTQCRTVYSCDGIKFTVNNDVADFFDASNMTANDITDVMIKEIRLDKYGYSYFMKKILKKESHIDVAIKQCFKVDYIKNDVDVSHKVSNNPLFVVKSYVTDLDLTGLADDTWYKNWYLDNHDIEVDIVVRSDIKEFVLPKTLDGDQTPIKIIFMTHQSNVSNLFGSYLAYTAGVGVECGERAQVFTNTCSYEHMIKYCNYICDEAFAGIRSDIDNVINTYDPDGDDNYTSFEEFDHGSGEVNEALDAAVKSVYLPLLDSENTSNTIDCFRIRDGWGGICYVECGRHKPKLDVTYDSIRNLKSSVDTLYSLLTKYKGSKGRLDNSLNLLYNISKLLDYMLEVLEKEFEAFEFTFVLNCLIPSKFGSLTLEFKTKQKRVGMLEDRIIRLDDIGNRSLKDNESYWNLHFKVVKIPDDYFKNALRGK